MTQEIVPAPDEAPGLGLVVLAFYDRAKQALQETHRVDECKDIRDRARSLEAYARQAGDHEMEMLCGEIRLRAERRAGALLIAMAAARERAAAAAGRPPKEASDGLTLSPTLATLGIKRNQSMTWQRVAQVPQATFDAVIARCHETKRPAYSETIVRLITKAVVRKEKVIEIEKRAAPEAELGRGYGIILADPPWRLAQMTSRRAIENQYPTLSTPEICALKCSGVPVTDLAGPDAVLFLWTPVPVLVEALEVMTAWGFTYRSQAVWVKPSIGMGQWFRLRHEILLLGARGAIPVPLEANRPDSVIEAPAGKHSQKPVAAYERIEKAFPEFRKLELFARKARDGWDKWGNEA